MNFHDINLPKCIEVFAVGQPQFATSSAVTISGRELVNLDRNYAKQKYLIKNCRLSQDQFEQFNAFFRARKGRAFAFRFKDYADYKVQKQIINNIDNKIKEFQLFKLYDDPISPYYRKITKPVKDSVKIYLDNEAIQIEVNYSNGIVTLERALDVNKILVADFLFDVVVRFGGDSFDYNMVDNGSIELSLIELFEVIE